MTYTKAKQLIRKDITAMNLEQVQKHKVRLIDAWRHSKGDYGMELAVKEGFFLIMFDSGAKGFAPRDMWLTHQIVSRMDEAEAHEAELLKKRSNT